MGFLLVLENSLQQIPSHADIEGVAPAGHDIRAIDLLAHTLNLSQVIDGNKQL